MNASLIKHFPMYLLILDAVLIKVPFETSESKPPIEIGRIRCKNNQTDQITYQNSQTDVVLRVLSANAGAANQRDVSTDENHAETGQRYTCVVCKSLQYRQY